MLSADEIKVKIEQLDDEAVKVGEPDGGGYRELAMKWRLVALEAVFMEAMRGSLAADQASDR